MLDNSLTLTTQLTSATSTPETKQSTTSPIKKIKSSLLFAASEPLYLSTRFPGNAQRLKFHLPSEALEVEFEVPPTYTVDQALRFVLSIFAQMKAVDPDATHYEVYVAKKNGMAKSDWPSFHGS